MGEITIHARQIEMVPLTSLKGYDRNHRGHPKAQVDAIADIVRDSGWTTPLLIDDDDVILAGHGRIEVAKKLKMAEVPCVRVSGLTEDQRKSLRISDNKTPEGALWLEDMLRLDIGDLRDSGFNLELTGFSSLELTNLFGTLTGETDPDEEPDAPETPVAQAGDLWRMGDHILVCGDSTDPAVVERALAGSRPQLCIADQPYGTHYKSGRRGTEFLVDGSNRSTGDVRNDHRADWREAYLLFQGDVLYVWHSPLEAATVQKSVEAAGFELRSQIIWRKVQPVVGPPKGHYRWQHEAAFYCVRKGGNGHWSGSHKESTVWDADRPKRQDTGHSTQKPVALWQKPIENHTLPGGHVFDPFAGSGVLTIACQMTKRIAHSIEIDPGHCDRHLLRFANFTGLPATLDGTGETFEEVKARRAEVV